MRYLRWLRTTKFFTRILGNRIPVRVERPNVVQVWVGFFNSNGELLTGWGQGADGTAFFCPNRDYVPIIGLTRIWGW